MSCDIRIGTSGYHYKHWRGPFYPTRTSAAEMLQHYSRYFDTVELNNSFYKLPTETMFEGWRKSTPPAFVFSVKMSRFLTHNKKLNDPEPALDKFLPRVIRLGKKLGPILFQLPPNWRVNCDRLEALLEILPPKLRYAFELRDPSWITRQVDRILERYQAAFCIYEIAGYQSPLRVTADFAYVRLHGPGAGKYQGSYDLNRLTVWSRQIRSWSRELRAVYIYFDNDQAGYAPQNALALKRMILSV
jgi:uncharacterized protein YecE (DUF72 family)